MQFARGECFFFFFLMTIGSNEVEDNSNLFSYNFSCFHFTSLFPPSFWCSSRTSGNTFPLLLYVFLLGPCSESPFYTSLIVLLRLFLWVGGIYLMLLLPFKSRRHSLVICLRSLFPRVFWVASYSPERRNLHFVSPRRKWIKYPMYRRI